MAVELCSINLWLEALEPGKPLSFLDHHIQVGNSLLGTTPALLEAGIPDDAFTPIEGDLKTRVTALKKQNKKEREEYKKGQGYLFDVPIKLGNLAAALAKIDQAPDDTAAAIQQKEQHYAELVNSTEYQYGRLLADLWCAAFVWKKDDSDLGKLCPTERDFRKVESHAASGLMPHVRKEVERLRDQYQFFHWHIAFPDVFRVGGSEEQGSEEQASTPLAHSLTPALPHSGFQFMLGNPPWEHTELKEKEWFSERCPAIATAKNAATRKALISELPKVDSAMSELFRSAVRNHDSVSHFLANSGRFPLCGRGRINVYTLFTELMRNSISAGGRVGCIVPSGIATDDTTKFFFQDSIDRSSLVSLFDFENRAGLFPDVDSRMKFSCLTLRANPTGIAGPLPAEFVFFAQQPEDLHDPDRRFTLSAADIALLNPNTRTCPIFRSRRDAELTKAIYRRTAILLTESADEGNPWNIRISRMLNGSDDAYLFHDPYTQNDALPIYESKFFWQFDHRYATFDGVNVLHCDGVSKLSPRFTITPQYRVVESELPEKFLRKIQGYSLAYRVISNATNERTLVASILPRSGLIHSANNVYGVYGIPCSHLLADLNTFIHDFSCRQSMGGANLSSFILHQVPAIRPSHFQSLQTSTILLSNPPLWFTSRVLELTYTALDLAPFARDCGYTGPPFRWDEERRFLIRAELDAAFFHLYLRADENGDWIPAQKADGCPHDESPEDLARLKAAFPTPRDAVSYIMDTFPIVRRKDEEKYNGDYRTKRVILEIYDAMQTATRTGQPYQTPLNPPPGPPTDANGNFLPPNQWPPDSWPSHIHPPRGEV